MNRLKDLNNLAIRNDISDIIDYINNMFKKAVEL